MSQEQEQYYNSQNQLQQSQEEQDDIPDYKQEFLTTLQKEYEEKQRQQQNSQYNSQFNTSKSFNLPSLNKVTNTNDVWNSSQYSSANWRQNLTTSHYNTQHNENQNNTQVETTAIVELFSTFFDKITSLHPQKDEMMKDLQQLKGQIYQNQNDLDKVQGYLQNLKEQKNSLNKNQNKFSNGNIKTESDKNSRNSNYSQNFNQIQNQNQINDNFGNQGFTFNRNFLKQNRNKVSKIGEFVDYKYQNQSNKEQIKEQLTKKGVQFLREFQTETLSGYRGLFFGYVENLIKGDQKEKIFEIINDVKSGRIQMKKRVFNENNNNYLTKNQDIERNISDKFVGYMQFIFDQMSIIQQKRRSEYNNVNNIQNQKQSLTIQNLVDDFYQMVNCDAEFDKGGLIYLKEILIQYINKSQNNGYQRQNLECLLSENVDVNEEILQLASQTLQMNITDLINQAEFVKEMLLIFEENNQNLKEKMEFMDEFDDEEESEEIDNINNILMEQIQNSQKNNINFYQEIQRKIKLKQ